MSRSREQDRQGVKQEKSVEHGKRSLVSDGNTGHQAGSVKNPAGTKRESVHRKPYDPASEGY